ncbi:twin transmembrane helix small protein [Marinicella gelatinilytica]|uniref:twin transmembrane helix small protein n=1 Tax=Marinicella gelatinilytica TaxID=2996017 RepID=UPI00226092BB|nr:twin transmembrane helix small protein [Marinicella gelatinilytica]MCX7544954.1 twin transmembrane helix small protein [Marinicella gelatinilytica]
MKYLIVIVFLFIIYSMGSALFYLSRDKGRSNNTVRFLTVRIIMSVALFLFILLAMKMGWIVPHGLQLSPTG